MLFPPPTPNSQFNALFFALSKKKKKQAYKQKQREGKKEIHKPL